MGITRGLIEWCDKAFNEALQEEDDRKAGKKAFASGAVEGFMDAAVMLYVPLLITCYVYKHKLEKK